MTKRKKGYMKVKTEVEHRTSGLKCQVPNCPRNAYSGWGIHGKWFRVCEYHHNRHFNQNDDFNFFDAFKLSFLKAEIGYDRFGFPLARDEKEMIAFVNGHREAEKTEKVDKSIERLRQWKEKNKGLGPRPKPKPIETRTKIIQTEADNVVDDILAGKL